MAINIMGGANGITVESDPTALKLTGGTLSGKLTGTATATNAALNIGTLTANPTSLSNGDIWIVDRLNFVNRLGNTIGVVTTNQASTISTSSTGNVVQIDQNGAGGGLLVRSTSTSTNLACVRIEQRGTGNALVVQDEADPDATPFVISNSGRLGIGVSPDTVAALKLDSGGIMFNDGTVLTTAPTGGGGGSVAWGGITGTLSSQTDLNTALNNKAGLASANQFTAEQVVSVNSSGNAVRINQTGAGNALVVEDSTNPDATPFVIDSNGRIGVGVAPSATAAIKVDSGGIMFNDGSTLTTAPAGGGSVAWGGITGTLSSQTDLNTALNGKADLSGCTFTGGVQFFTNILGSTATFSGNVSCRRLTCSVNAGIAALNIGVGGTDASSTVAGDLWITTGGVSLNYRDGNGAWRILPSLNNANTFSNNQVIAAATTSALLRITQTGTGNALLVEDTNNPDTTSFVITSNGDVGVGVATNFTPAVKFEVAGSFKATTITNGSGPDYAVNSVAVGGAGVPTHEISVSIGGSTYLIPAIFVSTP